VGVAAGVLVVVGRGSDSGCLRGLSSYRQVGLALHRRGVDSLLAIGGSGPHLLATTADGHLYAGSKADGSRFRWRRLGLVPGRLFAEAAGGRTLYAAYDALYRSKDGGRTWRRLSCGLLVDSAAVSGSTIYLATEQELGGGSGGGLYTSKDGGR